MCSGATDTTSLGIVLARFGIPRPCISCIKEHGKGEVGDEGQVGAEGDEVRRGGCRRGRRQQAIGEMQGARGQGQGARGKSARAFAHAYARCLT